MGSHGHGHTVILKVDNTNTHTHTITHLYGFDMICVRNKFTQVHYLIPFIFLASAPLPF